MIEKNEKSKKRIFWVALSVFAIIYLTDTLLFATSNITQLTTARRVVPVVIAVISIFRIPRIHFSVLLAAGSIFISMLLYMRDSSAYFYISAIALLICGYTYSYAVSLEEFEDWFIKWMRVIAVASLVGFFFGTVLKQINLFPWIRNTIGYSYRTFILTNIPYSDSLARRNLGPFWEPGVYQYYLNMALIFVLHRQSKTMWFDAGLFLVTLLTTLSGASILPLPFILLAYVMNNRQNRSMKPYLFIIAMLVLGIILLETGMFDEILRKITGEDDGLSSGFRIGSALANLKMTVRYPLFGASPGVQDQMRLETILDLNGVATSGNTNTFLGYTSYFGVFVGFFYWKRLYGFARKLSRSTFAAVCLFVALFLMTSNENLALSALLYVLMFLKPTSADGSAEINSIR